MAKHLRVRGQHVVLSLWAFAALCAALTLASTLALTGSPLLGQMSSDTSVGAPAQIWPVQNDTSPQTAPAFNDAQNEAQRRQDAERTLKDHEKNHLNREKELKQNFKGSKNGPKVDTTAAKAALTAMQQAVGNLRILLATGSLDNFWDANSDISDHYNAVQDAFQALYDSQTYVNLAGRFTDLKRQLKQMKGEMKRVGKEAKGTPEFAALETFVKTYESNLAAAEVQYPPLATADPEIVRDFESDLNDNLSSQEFYDKLQDVNDLANTHRMTKEAQRWPKDAERNYKQMSRECKRTKCKGKAAEGTLNAYKSLIEQLKTAVAQKDPETASDNKSDLDELNNTFWEQIQEVYIETDLKNLNRTAKDIGRMLQEAQREAKRGVKARINAATLQQIETGVAKFNVEVETANALFKAGNVEGARDAKDEAFATSNELQNLFAPLRDRGGDDGGPEDMNDILRDISDGLKNIDAALTKGTTSTETATFCRDLFNRARGIVQKVLDAEKSGNEAAMQQSGVELRGIGDEVDAPQSRCGAFMND